MLPGQLGGGSVTMKKHENQRTSQKATERQPAKDGIATDADENLSPQPTEAAQEKATARNVERRAKGIAEAREPQTEAFPATQWIRLG